MSTRTCERCGTPVATRRRYCDPCRVVAEKDRKRRSYLLYRDRTPEPVRDRTCPDCEKAFTPAIHNQKWCSEQCRRAASRQRLRGTVRLSIGMRVRRRVAVKIAGSVADAPWKPKAPRSSPKRRGVLPAPLASKKSKEEKGRKTTADGGHDYSKGPNLAGDWFPGWFGCWSPNIEPEWRDKLRERYGPDPEPKREED